MSVETLTEYFLKGLLIFLGVCILFAMIRAIRGPRIADRIIAINMIGTMTIISIAVLAILLKEGYLLDVCLIYVLISFLSVVVLCKVFVTV
ncbi:MAG: monovalent cation/H+ antiporter complex subunit F, partial [Clostridia bacterium]